jgi:YHS domain-containing protein
MIADQEKAAKEREAEGEASRKLELEQRKFIFLASDASTENVASDSDESSSEPSTAGASSSPVAAQMVSAPVSGSAATTPSPDDSATRVPTPSTQSDPSTETTATTTPSTATQPSTEEKPIASAPAQEPPVAEPNIAEPAVAPSATTEPADVAPTATDTAIPTRSAAKQPIRASLRYEPVVKESIALQPALPDAVTPEKPASVPPAIEKSSTEPSFPRPVASVAPNDTPAANKLVLAEVAMKGFCPVALHQAVRGNTDSSAGAWVLGNPAFAVRHRGRIYHCSSQEARETLLRSPDTFTPVLSGCDLVEFAKTGKWIDGECQFGFIEQRSGRVFLFSSRANYDEFARNCEAYSKMVGDSMRP